MSSLFQGLATLAGGNGSSIPVAPPGVEWPFQAPLKSSLILDHGTGSPTFARASVATVVDHEGLIKNVLSGEARFTGARRVKNLTVGKSDDFSNAAWTKNGTATVTGTNIINLPATGDSVTNPNGSILVVGRTYRFSVTLSGTGTVTLISPGGNEVSVTLSTSPVRFTTGLTVFPSDVNSYIIRRAANTATQVTARFAQTEDITGQANQNPSEYVSVGVLSTPFHGAGVDGVKYFQTENGNTVASNVVTEATGAAIADSTLKGYLAEGARTQLFATADIRNMTTASWVLGATMTRARTSVGADGAANSATRLTGGAVAATNTCYSTFVAAASSRTYSALVKRVTGTGPVRIVQTGTEMDISSLINSTTYTLVQLYASALNVAVGFKIDTNLDAIDVDFNQFEGAASASSSMAVTGARAADALTYPTSGNLNGTVGTCYAETYINLTSPPAQILVNTVASGQSLLYRNSGGNLGMYDGSTFLSDGAIANLDIVKVASKWSGSSMAAVVNGGSITQAAFVGDMAVGVAIIVANSSGADALFGNIRNVRIAQVAVADARFVYITTPGPTFDPLLGEATFFRSMRTADSTHVSFVPDTDQARSFNEGIAMDAANGSVIYSLLPPQVTHSGGLGTRTNGSVCVSDELPDVYHQGVGLRRSGRLCISGIPLTPQDGRVGVYNADNGVVLNGAVSVSAWNDRNPGTHHLLQAAPASQPEYLAYDGEPYAWFPGAASNYWFAANSPANQITGDIDIRVKAALNDWNPGSIQTIVAKCQSGTTRSYWLGIDAAGKLAPSFSLDGTGFVTAASTVAPGFVPGATHWIRVTRDFSTGAVNFYTSADGGNWTQLGTVVFATAGPLFNSTAILEVGSIFGGAAENIKGKIFRVELLDGIDGTLKTAFNPYYGLEDNPFNQNFRDPDTGVIWNIATSGNRPAQIVKQPSIIFDGVDDFLKTAGFTLAQPESVYLVVKANRWDSDDGFSDGNLVGTGLIYQAVASPRFRTTTSGGANFVPENSNAAVAVRKVIAVRFQGATSLSQVNLNTVVTGDAGTGNMGGFNLGCNSTPTQYAAIQVYAARVFNVAHDDEQREAMISALMDQYNITP